MDNEMVWGRRRPIYSPPIDATMVNIWLPLLERMDWMHLEFVIAWKWFTSNIYINHTNMIDSFCVLSFDFAIADKNKRAYGGASRIPHLVPFEQEILVLVSAIYDVSFIIVSFQKSLDFYTFHINTYISFLAETSNFVCVSCSSNAISVKYIYICMIIWMLYWT